jgi:hypothetical protein
MNYKQIIFSGHAIRQMFHREISKNDVIEVIDNGQTIVDYSDDKPYPSCLMLGYVNNKPIHVVFAIDQENETGIVITAYIPDIRLWTEDFKSRRNKK